MSWAMSAFTYVPDPNYHGQDSFLVLVEDEAGAVSQLLEVQIAVLANPCINKGTCSGRFTQHVSQPWRKQVFRADTFNKPFALNI